MFAVKSKSEYLSHFLYVASPQDMDWHDFFEDADLSVIVPYVPPPQGSRRTYKEASKKKHLLLCMKNLQPVA